MNGPNVDEFTVPEKILLAADTLDKQGQSPFSAEALIVVSWQKFPKTFGLKGYADQYPDSNKVLSSIMGERGLTRRGWLAKMGQKLYTLTREGKQVVLRLQEGGEPPPTTARVTIDKRYGTFQPPATGQPPEVVPPRAPKPNTERTDNLPTTTTLPGELPGTPGNPTQRVG